MENKIIFTTDEGEKVEMFVLEQTKLNGINYLLVSESEDDEEAIGYVMKEANEDSGNVTYSIVEDDVELSAVAGVFEELLEDEIDLIAEDDAE